MQVSRYDVCRRVAAHRPGEHFLPDLSALARIDPGVDDDPAAYITKQPEIDVVQRERQGHAQPGNAIRHGHGFARTGA